MGTIQLDKKTLRRLGKEIVTLSVAGKKHDEIATILNAAGHKKASGEPLDRSYISTTLFRLRARKRTKRAVKPVAKPFTRISPMTQADEILAIITLPVSQKVQRKLLQAYLSEES